jgi:hypothetical protein
MAQIDLIHISSVLVAASEGAAFAILLALFWLRYTGSTSMYPVYGCTASDDLTLLQRRLHENTHDTGFVQSSRLET